MLYKCTYTDGSEELVEGKSISQAKAAAEKLYDVPVKRVVVQDDPLEDEEEGATEEDDERE